MMSTPTSRAQRPNERGSIDQAIDALRRAEFSAQDLLSLSDLDRSEVRALAQAWPSVSLEARISAVRQMAEVAEEQFELRFGRALRIAIDDASPIVRQLAVDALWEDRGADLLAKLLDVMRHDESVDVRAAAAQGLARFAEEAALDELNESQSEGLRDELLAQAADQQQSLLVRRRALESVATFGAQPEIVTLIRKAYDADDSGLRAGALYAMGRTLDPRWLNVLESELESPDAEMRYEAARACGEIGDSQSVPSLVRCAEDSDAEVRQAAITALGGIGSMAAMRALEHLHATARPSDRLAIEDVLHDVMSDANP